MFTGVLGVPSPAFVDGLVRWNPNIPGDRVRRPIATSRAIPDPSLMMLTKAVASVPTCTDRLAGNTAATSVAAGEGQPSDPRRQPRGARDGRGDHGLARASSEVPLRRAAVARVPAALQPLRGRHVVRRPRRQRDPPDLRHAVSDSHGPGGDVVLEPAPGSTTAGSWWRRTRTARTRSCCRPGT